MLCGAHAIWCNALACFLAQWLQRLLQRRVGGQGGQLLCVRHWLCTPAAWHWSSSRAQVTCNRPMSCTRTPVHICCLRPACVDELQLVMTQVQRSDPARPFKVAVRIMPDNTYRGAPRHSCLAAAASYMSVDCTCSCAVSRCDPQVPGLPALVEVLNTSNQFSTFVKGLRVEWQRMAEQPQAGHS